MATKIRWSTQVNLDGNIDLNNTYKIVNVPAPENAGDVVNKSYVDLLVQGLKWKEPVKTATTGNISSLEGLMEIDRVQLVDGDRVLVKDQTIASQNGIYIAHTGAWERAPDADSGDKLVSAAVFVIGTDSSECVNKDKGFVCTNDSITIGTTDITFVNFTTTGGISAGLGINVNGTEISVKPDTTRAIDVDVNGVYAKVKTNGGVLIDSLDGLYLDRTKTYLLADAYRQDFTGDGSTTSFALSYTPYFNDYVNFNIIVSLNGVVQLANSDYTVSGSNIVFATAPANGDVIQVYYVKQS